MDADVSEQSASTETIQQILSFFKKNGFTEAEEALSKEAASVLRQKDGADGDACNDTLMHEFAALLSHIDNSFDCFKIELSTLVFPIFAHLYIQLIAEGHTLQAATFSEKFAKNVPKEYEEQVKSLSRISTHTQAANHPLVQTLKKNHFVVRLSKTALKQLEPLLNRNTILKDVVRDHLTVEAVDGTRSKAAVEEGLGGLLGQVSKQERRHKMFYGAIKEDITSQLGLERKRLKGKDRSDLKKKDANGPLADRIPLPNAHVTREVGRKLRIAADAPPTVCIYTLCNADGGVTCAEISDDTLTMAAGFGNSSIQVFALGEEKLRPLKRVEELEALDQDAEDIFEQVYDDAEASTSLTFRAHHGPVYSVSFSPNKRLLLSSSRDETVRLWNFDTQSNVVTYRYTSPIWQVQFCPRSYYFATGNADGSAMLWVTDRLQPLRIFSDAYSDVGCIDFHPNCNYVAGGSDDRYVRVWDVLTGTCVRTFAGHKDAVRGIKVSPCGRYLASLGAEGSLIIWDLALQKMVAMQNIAPFPFSAALQFSRDGNILVVAHADSAISFYSMEALLSHSGQQEQLINEPRVDPSGFHLFTYTTKNTPVVSVHFTRRNLPVVVGAFGQ